MRRTDFAALSIVVLLVGAPAVIAVRSGQDKHRVVQCSNNLQQLWKMQANYMVQFGGPSKSYPTETGDEFWLKLSKTTPPLIDTTLSSIYLCPLQRHKHTGCDYRGPKSDVNKYADGDPVGADVDGNHGSGKGGNVIRKSDHCVTVAADDIDWKLAEEKTTGGNKPVAPAEPQEETPKQKQACVHIGQLAIATMLYKEFMGDWPKTLQDLVEKPRDTKFWPEGGFVAGGKVPKDPWGNDYQYKHDNDQLKIWSWGADGKEGGEGENADLTLEDVFKGRGEAGGGSTPRMSANERNASACLKVICTAEADFRSNDRDNNRMNDFWTGDVSGLYRILYSDKTPLRLIEKSVAEADAAPLHLDFMVKHTVDKPTPKAGYFFRAMEKDENGQAYAQDTDDSGKKCRNLSKFGFCTYPAEYGKTGKMTFIVNESFTFFKKDTGGKPVEKWPTDAELAKEWSKMD